jgi:hypothetical protein
MAIKTSDGRRSLEMSPELARRMAMRIVNVPLDHQEAAFAVVQGELEAMKKSEADKSLARQWVDASMEEIRRLVERSWRVARLAPSGALGAIAPLAVRGRSRALLP